MDAVPCLAVQGGSLVLESIGRQQGVRALLSLSTLHDQIRTGSATDGAISASDLVRTERFVLHEVLQLICARTQTLTKADAVMVALAEGTEFVCRAAAGPLPIPTGVHLNQRSRLLRDALQSGQILRCDDSQTDARVEFDLARQLGTRSTVIVPLRGRAEHLGVLQAFSAKPWSLTDQDIRCFDLFAELVLSALKPADQDRRILWLSDIAKEVLEKTKTEAVSVQPQVAAFSETGLADSPAGERLQSLPAKTPPVAEVETKASPSAANALSSLPIAVPVKAEPKQLLPLSVPSTSLAEISKPEIIGDPIVIPVASTDLPEEELPVYANEALASPADDPVEVQRATTAVPRRTNLLPFKSSPGLNVVMGLVAVAALFSAGVWWGMQVHSKTPVRTTLGQRSVTAPAAPAPDVLSTTASDNLMTPAQPSSQDAPLTAVSPDKLAALPKITGVRHWSSSMGSTVVIDMEDQVPYEVHRLMQPERIYFDLHDTALTADLDGKSMDVGDSSLSRVRVAQPVAGVTRIVLDTKDGSNFSVSMESNPYRLVVELRDNSKLVARMAPIVPTPTKPASNKGLATAVSPQPIPARTGKFRVVLDAGHGGWDLGTVGRQGLLEKDLVLDVTQRLGKLLKSRLNSDVVFTRTGDDYLALDQRADFANQSQADLFVSVHANYSNSANARGVETYYTNSFSAPGSKEAASHSADKRTEAATYPVSLSSGELHEKIEGSRRLAASIQRALYATLAAKSPDIRDRGIKDASFAVLTGTTMPSILTEISFVSSPTDEHNLQSETYRQQIAEALFKGIARYQESTPHSKVAQLRTASAGR
jgi:N-acetylmuramoyl-L-alanine amidase